MLGWGDNGYEPDLWYKDIEDIPSWRLEQMFNEHQSKDIDKNLEGLCKDGLWLNGTPIQEMTYSYLTNCLNYIREGNHMYGDMLERYVFPIKQEIAKRKASGHRSLLDRLE